MFENQQIKEIKKQGDLSNVFSLDIETTGLDRFQDRILAIGVYNPGFNKCFDSVDAFISWHRSHHDSPKYIAHRGAFDFNFLRHFGADVCNHWEFDTRSLASLLIPGPGLAIGQKHELGLENLAIQLLHRPAYKLDRANMGSFSSEEVQRYCLEDCKVTYELFQLLKERLPKKSWAFVEGWLMPATRFCAELEWNGVNVDKEGLALYQKEIESKRLEILNELQQMARPAVMFYHEQQVREISRAYREMYDKAKIKAKDKEKCRKRYALLESAAISRLGPFNWNSSEQLKWLLRDYYQLDIRSEREDKETTNEAMLKTLDHPVAKRLVDYREMEKLCSTCIPALLENLAEDGNVHANYNIGGTRTGRLSSSGPNLQQIPKGPIRGYVRANSPSSVLLTIDYSQIEVRIMAELAGEDELIHAFKEGIDPYSVIAQKLLKIETPVKEIKERHKKERDVSKTAGLSILYGTGPGKLQEVLRKELGKDYSLAECRQFIEGYRESLPGIKALRSRLDRQLANGKVAYNLLGRPFHIASNDDIYMKALNTLVQGSASDLVIYSQFHSVEPLLKALDVNYHYRMLIHDEVVIELPQREAELLAEQVIVPAMTTELERDLNLTVPLAVEYNISQHWHK